MKNKMAELRKYRKVPAKRGLLVRDSDTGKYARILSVASNGNLAVRCESTGVRRIYHPFSLDYYADGIWKLGDEYKARFDARINAQNERMRYAYESRRGTSEFIPSPLEVDLYSTFLEISDGICERGFMSAISLKMIYGVSTSELDEMVRLNWLCMLSNHTYDLPARRDARLRNFKDQMSEQDSSGN